MVMIRTLLARCLCASLGRFLRKGRYRGPSSTERDGGCFVSEGACEATAVRDSTTFALISLEEDIVKEASTGEHLER